MTYKPGDKVRRCTQLIWILGALLLLSLAVTAATSGWHAWVAAAESLVSAIMLVFANGARLLAIERQGKEKEKDSDALPSDTVRPSSTNQGTDNTL